MSLVCEKSSTVWVLLLGNTLGAPDFTGAVHKRLAHLNLIKYGLKAGMDYKISNFNPCTACVEGKLTSLPFPKKSQSKSKGILVLVHMDVVVPTPMQSSLFSGAGYFVTFKDGKKLTFIACKEKVK